MNTIRLVTASSLLLTAACSGSDDIWFPAEDPGGKADSVATIRGSDIPSAHVDANKSYLLARRIDQLNAATALDMIESRLAERIDGIIANMPKDGKLHLAELVRMEDPAIHDSLFPEEVAALPRLWTKVEAPSTNALFPGVDITLGVLDAASPPGPAVPPANLAISTLATDLATAATRLQNVFNADNNTATVQLADLDNGIANPGAFTPAEVQAFGTIKAIFREKAVATADATLVVSPTPGPFAHSAMLGPIAIEMTGLTKIEEDRQHLSSSLTLRLIASQTMKSTAQFQMDAKVLVIHKDSTAEVVFGPGDVPSITPGPCIVEVWQQNQRVFSTNVALPAMSRNQQLDLTDKLDYTLASGLSPLVRNTVSATFNNSSLFTAKFSYDKVAIPPTGTPHGTALQRTATPKVQLPVGRYSFPSVQSALLVYPNNVLWVQRAGQMWRLLPQGNGGVPTRFANTQFNVSFETTNNSFVMSNPSFSATLNASMRDI